MFSRIVLILVAGLGAAPCPEGGSPNPGPAEFELILHDTDYSMARTRIYRLTNGALAVTVGGLQRDRDRPVFRHEFDSDQRAELARVLDSIDFAGLKEQYSNDCVDDGSQIQLFFKKAEVDRSVRLSNYYFEEVGRIIGFGNSIVPADLQIWYDRERLLRARERCQQRKARQRKR